MYISYVSVTQADRIKLILLFVLDLGRDLAVPVWEPSFGRYLTFAAAALVLTFVAGPYMTQGGQQISIGSKRDPNSRLHKVARELFTSVC